MGFDIYAARGVIEFEGTRYKGAEITVRLDVPVGEWDGLVALATLDDEGVWMVEHGIESWNLEAGGKALPLTAEAFNKLPRPFRRRLITEYIKAVSEIDAPLVEPSSSGDTSPEE